jgi:membrane-bound ClpP family serine protease
MFQGYALVALLLAIGVILLIGELLLPTAGLVGLIGVVAIIAAIVVAGMQNVWAAALLTVALAIATPLLWGLWMKIWPRTPIGRRVILPPVDSTPPPPPVTVGQAGVAISQLRPMGICEFASPQGASIRVEAHSEHGMIEPGTTIRVVALVNNRPTVRIA